MACAQQPYGDFCVRLFQKALARRVPLSGTLELTYACNLRCLHCYIPSHSRRDELSAAEWLRLIDEAARAGCAFLLLTGGEPLLHPHFAELYLHARRNGIIVSVFTNGTHLPGERLGLLVRHPPYVVDVSLYGASDATYARVTGRPEFGRVLEHLRAMRSAGLALQVKITLLQENLHDLPAMAAVVESLGLPIRLNAAMTHRYDGDGTPAGHRLTPRDIVNCEAAFPSVAAEWRRSFARRPDATDPGALYGCGAGRSSFAVTPDGRLLPCATEQRRAVSLRGRRFEEAWRILSDAIDGLRRRPNHPCLSCRHASRCLQCASWAALDVGDEQAVVSYVCELAHRRAARFGGGSPHPAGGLDYARQ